MNLGHVCTQISTSDEEKEAKISLLCPQDTWDVSDNKFITHALPSAAESVCKYICQYLGLNTGFTVYETLNPSDLLP